ncbi:uncharacterized protein LOC110911052 [Helianthus annuus]|uniref:uncharacterized protein LOC110911052 n=1 Tax=Helianthus annuus TaxID=4232 RepID=UPI0016531CD5|nr:uncharacterized protein LOC110911052 [Helianthus annuus]XP_035839617.1 uncharacterized protein LOC110911052 [Helianthus annuus]XP_035839618.1 uncharacterized protein LOC110911052 [Helianthus annuus]
MKALRKRDENEKREEQLRTGRRAVNRGWSPSSHHHHHHGYNLVSQLRIGLQTHLRDQKYFRLFLGEEGNIGFFYKLLCCCTKIMCKGLWINDDKRAAICNAAMLIPIGYFLIRYGLYKPSLFTGQP